MNAFFCEQCILPKYVRIPFIKNRASNLLIFIAQNDVITVIIEGLMIVVGDIDQSQIPSIDHIHNEQSNVPNIDAKPDRILIADVVTHFWRTKG